MLTTSTRSFITSFLTLTLICAAIIGALAPLLYFVGVTQAVIAIGVFVGTCCFVLFSSNYIKLSERRESKEKSEQYRQFMRALRELLSAVNDDLTGTSDLGKERISFANDTMREACYYLTLTAPDDVLVPIHRAARFAPPSPCDDLERDEYLQRWMVAILAIRRDCGFSKTKVGEVELLTMLRNDSYFVDQDED